MILAISGSPRKKGNTATLLQKALEGASSVGAQTEFVSLYPLNFKGCSSCFSCKLKTGRHGHCAMNDDLTPLLEKMEHADAILIGSPVYFSDVTACVRALEERFLFSHMLYNKQDRWIFSKKIPSAFVYAWGAEEAMALEVARRFEVIHTCAEALLGVHPEILHSTNSWQFSDYSKYEADQFDVEAKKKARAEQFPLDCQNAFNLGVQLATTAQMLQK